MRKLIVSLFLFTLYSGAGAQNHCNFSIRGVVEDSSESLPLDLCRIEYVQKKKSTETNDSGYFVLNNICKGEVELHISHLNCEHLHLRFKLNSDTFLHIRIRHKDQVLKGVGIEGRSSHMNLLNRDKLSSANSLNIANLMEQLPGISLLKTGFNTAKPMVNGLHSNRVIVLNNGIRQEGQNWGMEHAPEIDPYLASEIQLLKGPKALRYASDGIGGVVLIQSPDLFKQEKGKLNGEVNTAFQSNGRAGTLSGILGSMLPGKVPLYWRIQGTLQRSGNFKTARDFIDNTATASGNFSAAAGHKGKRSSTEVFYSRFYMRNGIYTGAQTGNLSDLNKAMSAERPLIKEGFSYDLRRPYQDVMHELSRLDRKQQLNSRHSLELRLSRQFNHRREYDIKRSGNSYDGPDFDYYIRTLMADLSWQRTSFHGFSLQAGAFALHQSNAYTGRFFIPGFYRNAQALYFLTETKAGFYRIEAGMRIDRQELRAFLWKGNVQEQDMKHWIGPGYSIRVNRKFRQINLSLLHGSTFRAPAANELYSNGLHQGLASIEIGNPEMKPERSFNQSLELSFNKKSLNLEAEVFNQYVVNFINLTPDREPMLNVRGAFPVYRYSATNAMLNGLNINLRMSFNRQFKLEARAQMMNGTDLKKGNYLNQMPPYSFRVNVSKTLGDWQFSINNRTVLRQFRYVDSSDYLAPPPTFSLIGLEIQFKPKQLKNKASFILSIDNALNSDYRDYLNRMRYFYSEQGRKINFKIKFPIL